MARAKQDERLAFFDPYVAQDSSPVAASPPGLRGPRHLSSTRLERHHLGNITGVQAS
ncbi:hypothetical protein [Streptomyces virginiae]|uniref:hypothetical protein n=1 Tax=Streptomyces virginiae TaxID=1961 RepID=UPI0036FA9B62